MANPMSSNPTSAINKLLQLKMREFRAQRDAATPAYCADTLNIASLKFSMINAGIVHSEHYLSLPSSLDRDKYFKNLQAKTQNNDLDPLDALNAAEAVRQISELREIEALTHCYVMSDNDNWLSPNRPSHIAASATPEPQ